MKTRIKNLLPLLFLLALPAVVQAQDAYSTNADGSIYTYSTNADGSANIVAYAGPPWVVTIPTNINGLTVTTIGTNAFENEYSLTSVTIPYSVTGIGEEAFVFTSLTVITVDTNNPAYSSANGVLFDKSQTTLIQYPGGLGGSYTISNSVTSIGDFAFDGSGITSVTIPNSVTSIGNRAFNVCRGLTSVTIGNNVTSIGDTAFNGCWSLTSVTIPNSVISIGDGAFNGSGLTSMTIPNSVASIGGDAFESCFGLKSATIGNSVTSIGGGAFFDCTGLTNVTIGNNVTNIGDYAFYLCASLTSVTFPNSVTSIGDSAFYNCNSLRSVTIGNSVTNIGSYAFQSCSGLTGVYFQGNSPSPTNDSTVFYGDPATVYYLPGTTGWGAMFDGRPTAPWFLPNPQILNRSAGFGVQPGGFGFTISWATNASVVVQAATNLASPVWLSVSTNTLTGGTNYFSDPQWTNYPARFYRAQLAP